MTNVAAPSVPKVSLRSPAGTKWDPKGTQIGTQGSGMDTEWCQNDPQDDLDGHFVFRSARPGPQLGVNGTRKVPNLVLKAPKWPKLLKHEVLC